jgi:hypothetical protein
MTDREDDLTERRERREDDGIEVALTAKGQALWAALEERDRQRPGEHDDVYRARMFLTEGAALLRLAQVGVHLGYMRPMPGVPPLGPAGTCMAPSGPGSLTRCKRKPVMFGLCQRHLDEADAEADAEVAARTARPARQRPQEPRERPRRSGRGQEAAKAARRREADERRAERRRERDARRAEEREPFEGQCAGLTRSGRRCRYVAVAGGRCPLHGGSAGPEGP